MNFDKTTIRYQKLYSNVIENFKKTNDELGYKLSASSFQKTEEELNEVLKENNLIRKDPTEELVLLYVNLLFSLNIEVNAKNIADAMFADQEQVKEILMAL